MPYVPINIVLDRMLPSGGALNLAYPEGKNEGHLFSGFNHTLTVEGSFFRCPRDFIINTQPDRIIFTWRGDFALPAGTLMNVQLEAPGGDFYFDPRNGVTVSNMVVSPMFMVNLAAPHAPAADFYYFGGIDHTKPVKLLHNQPDCARNVVVQCEADNSHTHITVEGEDLYFRSMLEKIQGPADGVAVGNKAFSRITKITATHPCNGNISIGTGTKIGLPVFVPAPGFLMREVINGNAVTGGTIVKGETLLPTATSGDCRGTYTPPAGTSMDGKTTIHLLFSLPNPGNIGMFDYAG